MKFDKTTSLSFLAFVSLAACGSDVLRFSEEGDANTPLGMGGAGDGDTGGSDNGDGDGDSGTGATGPGDGDGGTGATGPGPGPVPGDGGGGGTGGAIIEPGPVGGWGGMGGSPPIDPPDPNVFFAGNSDITDMEMTVDGLFWTEYGTFDDLENYQRDGRLLFLDNGASEPVVLAEDLHGPRWLSVTDDEVYLRVDASILNSLDDSNELWRYDRITQSVDYVTSMGGGLVTHGPDACLFRNIGDLVLLDDAGVGEVIGHDSREVFDVEMDDTAVYFASTRLTMNLIPLAGGDVTTFEDTSRATRQFVLYEDTIVGLDIGDPSYLVQIPKSGDAPWQNIAEVEVGKERSLQRFEDRYFVMASFYRSNYTDVVTGLLSDPQATQVTFRIPANRATAMAANHDYMYFTNSGNYVWESGSDIYRVPVPQ